MNGDETKAVKARGHPVRRAGLWMLVLLITGSLAGGPGLADSRNGIAGIPFPESPPVYHVPVSQPSKVIQGNGGVFSHNESTTRYAWDFELPLDSPVVAARAGMVQYVRMFSAIGGADPVRFWTRANLIVIDHLDGTRAQYMHLAKDTAPVRKGDYVIQGERIAANGDTGYALGPHLHFSVVRSLDGESLPCSFSDYSRNNGVPLEGHIVSAAGKPAVPQKAITAYKNAWAACRRAEEIELPDLAYFFITSPALSRRYREYFYDRVFLAKETVLKEKVIRRLAILSGGEPPPAVRIPESLRFQEILSGVKNREILVGLDALKQATRKSDGKEEKRWKSERRADNDWIEGLRRECMGDVQGALSAYTDAMNHQRGLFKEQILAALHRLLHTHRSDFALRLVRLEEEIGKAEPAHMPRIAKDADQAWRQCKELFNAWSTYFPKERAKARADLEAARARHKVIRKHKG